MEFLQLSETTRAHEIDVELKKNKWRNERLDPTRAWVAPGPLLDIFFGFSVKPKFFTPTHGYLTWKSSESSAAGPQRIFGWIWAAELADVGSCA